MRYRSAAFARLSAHALAGDGSTHFPARGVDADAFLGPAALLYLLSQNSSPEALSITFASKSSHFGGALGQSLCGLRLGFKL